MGHTDIATTAIYLHSDVEREKAAAVKIGQAFLGKETTSDTTSEVTSAVDQKTARKAKKTGI